MTSVTFRDESGQPCVPNLIDGKPIIQPPAVNFPVISTAKDQQVIHYGQTTTLDLAIRAVDSAFAAFKLYKTTPVDERRRLLLRTADLFEGKRNQARDRHMEETSATEEFADINAHAMGRLCREAAAALDFVAASEPSLMYDGSLATVVKEPVGPVLMIMPWNGATSLPSRGIASALAAGCTVVLKASEMCPWTHYLVAETFIQAGFPPGSVNMVMADRAAGPKITEAIIAHPSLSKVEFIGSAAVGKAIGMVAAKHLKPVIMELGDQSPLIVLDDADLQKAAVDAVTSGMQSHGQVCWATERIIVQNTVKDKFCNHLKNAMEKCPTAGTAASKPLADKAKAAVDDAVKRGAKFLHGTGDMLSAVSLGPCVLTDVTKDSILSKEEGFAPLLTVVAVDTDDQAILEANSGIGGLSASVYTADSKRGSDIARQLEFGQVCVNLPTNHGNPRGPVTGWKGSGWGSHGGRYGVELFLQNKAIMVGSSPSG